MRFLPARVHGALGPVTKNFSPRSVFWAPVKRRKCYCPEWGFFSRRPRLGVHAAMLWALKNLPHFQGRSLPESIAGWTPTLCPPRWKARAQFRTQVLLAPRPARGGGWSLSCWPRTRVRVFFFGGSVSGRRGSAFSAGSSGRFFVPWPAWYFGDGRFFRAVCVFLSYCSCLFFFRFFSGPVFFVSPGVMLFPGFSGRSGALCPGA